MATLKNVAQAEEVSISTLFRALNISEQVHLDPEVHVYEVADGGERPTSVP